MAVVVAPPRRPGRLPLPWEDVELVQLEELSVRHRAIRWLEANGKLSHPLSTSSDQGCRTYLGKCKEHEGLLPMTSLSLRLAAVEYLRPLGRMFADRMEGPFRGRYDSYINFTMQESSWGDELTCLACAHLLRRPIHIVTDSVDNLSFVSHQT